MEKQRRKMASLEMDLSVSVDIAVTNLAARVGVRSVLLLLEELKERFQDPRCTQDYRP